MYLAYSKYDKWEELFCFTNLFLSSALHMGNRHFCMRNSLQACDEIDLFSIVLNLLISIHAFLHMYVGVSICVWAASLVHNTILIKS